MGRDVSEVFTSEAVRQGWEFSGGDSPDDEPALRPLSSALVHELHPVNRFKDHQRGHERPRLRPVQRNPNLSNQIPPEKILAQDPPHLIFRILNHCFSSFPQFPDTSALPKIRVDRVGKSGKE